MSLPDSIRRHIEKNNDCRITNVTRVSGGSINQAAKVTLDPPGTCFLKWNTATDPDMFEKETRGLRLLREAGTGLRIPDVLSFGALDSQTGYLLMEFVEVGGSRGGSAESFGRKLASLHQNRAGQFGLDHDNYIGRLPQSNTLHDDWVTFLAEERFDPQVSMAVDDGKLPAGISKKFEALYHRLPELLPEEPPALLHGDLWGGNFFYTADGNAAVYDPAVYYGHREIELAFTKLFGGFSESFYRAYREAYPLEPDFKSRVDLYNLYPLLVHTNLFGGHYGSQVESIVRRFG